MKESDARVLAKFVSEIGHLETLMDGVDLRTFLDDETKERAGAMIGNKRE